MKRITSVLLAVLLGALATGIGVTPFFVLANKDRHRLATELEETQARTQQIEAEKEQVADNANKKVEEANAEIERAQQILEEVGEDQRLMVEAKRLSMPPRREIARWEPVISLYQEVKLSMPEPSEVVSDNTQALTISKEQSDDGHIDDARWLAVTPYDTGTEAVLLNALATSTDIAYVVDDRLLKGRKGTLESGEEALIIRVRYSATSTHLIWIKDPGTLGREDGFERLLGTFEFNS
jgi:hypothetical protein